MLTGAGGRLGRPCALAFAAEGARLLLTDVAVPALEETARLARARGATVVAVPADVTRRADVEAALAEGRRRLGPVDVLVNFAGYVPVSSVLEVSEEEWDRVFAVNVKGTMLCCQAVGARDGRARRRGPDREHLVGRVDLGAGRRRALLRLEGGDQHAHGGARHGARARTGSA